MSDPRAKNTGQRATKGTVLTSEFVTLVRLSSLGRHVGVLALAGYKRRKSALTAGPYREQLKVNSSSQFTLRHTVLDAVRTIQEVSSHRCHHVELWYCKMCTLAGSLLTYYTDIVTVVDVSGLHCTIESLVRYIRNNATHPFGRPAGFWFWFANPYIYRYPRIVIHILSSYMALQTMWETPSLSGISAIQSPSNCAVRYTLPNGQGWGTCRQYYYIVIDSWMPHCSCAVLQGSSDLTPSLPSHCHSESALS